MNEKILRNIAITCSITGLIMLFFISENLEPEEVKIRDITSEFLEENVKICGEISQKVVSNGQHMFLTLEDNTDSIKVVIFNNTAKNLRRFNIDVYQFQEKDAICVSGEVNEYKGEIEIICEKIEIKKNVS